MGKVNSDRGKRAFTFSACVLLGILVLGGCASHRPEASASLYRFQFKDRAYRIRSISSMERAESYNELIGQEFVAADFDQDQIIDRIMLGEASLPEAQQIYEHGLDLLGRENRLRVGIPDVDRYVYDNCDFNLEIISFRPQNAGPFNEFKIIDKRQVLSPPIVVLIDQNADGVLDEIVKGAVDLEKAKSQYAETIAAGLQQGGLVKVNGAILVKER